MVLCAEEISSGSEPNSRAVIVHPAEGSTDEAPHSEPEQMIADSQAHASQSDHEGASPSATPPKMSEGSDRDSSVVQPAHEGKNTGMTSERALQPSQKWALSLPHGQGGISPSGKAEKASEDGYNWRKYGQKNVKGNEFIRSYYKCTHSNCLVKKQVERSLEGQITDTLYFGQHDHPKPHINVPQTIGLVLSIVEEKAEKHSSAVIEEKSSENRGQTCQQVKTTETPLSPVVIASADVKSTTLLSPRSRLRDEAENGDDPSSKRKKKENRSVDAASVDKATGESRFTIQTKSEVDIVNDGHRWRKYGQKLVKGNPNPRSYYRCSSPGCPAKKHVERASHDPKVVMTTYEGQHDHSIPTARNVISNPAGTDSATVVQSVEARTKSEEGAAVSADAAVREEISDRPSELTEQQNDESANKCDETRSSTSEHESIPKELQKGEPPSPCKSHGETGNPSDSVPQRRLNEEQSNNQSTAKMEEIKEGCLNKLGKKPNEQQEVLSTAAAVPS